MITLDRDEIPDLPPIISSIISTTRPAAKIPQILLALLLKYLFLISDIPLAFFT